MIETLTVRDETLAAIGDRIRRAFTLLEQYSRADHADGISMEAIENESQRFGLWAVNMGLYHYGHSSLDYRFRDAPSVYDFAHRLLRDLEKCLSIMLSITVADDVLVTGSYESEHAEEKVISQSSHEAGNPEAPDELSLLHVTQGGEDEDIESEGSDNEDLSSYKTQSLAHLAFENLVGVIERLYRLSFKIRSSKTRIGFSKAVNYHKVDEDSGIDLINRYAEEDLRHVQEVIKQSQSVSMEECRTHYLVHRLAKANTRRRQQFGQWRKHKNKLELAERRIDKDGLAGPLLSKLSPSAQNLEIPLALKGPPVSRPSTATRVLDANVDLDDTISMISSSTYAVIAEEPGDTKLNIPRPPKSFNTKKEFECPYCFTLCSRRTLGMEAWQAHVLRDLRPYVCTYENCKEGDQLYDTFKEWAGHELRSHGAGPQCSDHPDKNSFSLESYQEHMHNDYQDGFGEEQQSRATSTAKFPSMDVRRPCPFCPKQEATSGHIGFHLQNIALFALPRSTGVEEGSEQRNIDSDNKNQDSQCTKSMSDLDDLSSLPRSEDGDLTIASRNVAIGASKIQQSSLTEDALQLATESSQATYESKVAYFFQQIQEDAGSPKHSASPSISSGNRLHQPETEPEGTDQPVGVFQSSSKPYALDQSARNREPDERFPMDEQTAAQVQLSDYVTCAKTLREDHPDRIAVKAVMTTPHVDQGQSKQADELVSKISRIKRKLLESDDPETLIAVGNLAWEYRFRGQLEQSEELQAQVLQAMERLLGVEHPTTIAYHADLYWNARKIGKHSFYAHCQWDDKATLLESFSAKMQVRLGDQHSRTMSVMADLASTRRQQGKTDEAVLIERDIMEKRMRLSGTNHRDTISAMISLGYSLEAQGKLNEAISMQQDLLNNRERNSGEDTSDTTSATREESMDEIFSSQQRALYDWRANLTQTEGATRAE